MNKFAYKLKIAAPFYLLTVLVSTVGILLLRVLNDKYLGIDIKVSYWQIYVPPFVVIAAAYLLKWKGYKRAKLIPHGSNENPRFNLIFFPTSFIIVASMLLQQAYSKKSSPLQHVGNVYQISNASTHPFYTIDSFYLEQSISKRAMTWEERKIRSRLKLVYTFYYITPMTDHYLTPATDNYKYWYGQKYDTVLSSNISELELSKAAQRFYDDCTYRVSLFDYTSVNYFKSITKERDRYNFFMMTNRAIDTTGDNFVVLEPYLSAFKDRGHEELKNFFISIALSLIFFLVILAYSRTKEVHNE